MADMETTYGDGGVTTTTQGQAVPGQNNDMEFFKQMALHAVAPRPVQRQRAAAPVRSSGGMGANQGFQTSPEQGRASQMANMQRKMAEVQMRDQMAEMAYKQQLRDFDINGPKKRNLVGGPQMIGGFIEDRDSIPYSLRGKLDFANTPGDAARELPFRQANSAADFDRFANRGAVPQTDDRADFFGTGTTNPAAQGLILQNNATQRRAQWDAFSNRGR